MKHLFVPYELALKLKKKGFDEPCIATIDFNRNSDGWVEVFRIKNTYDGKSNYDLPLYQQVIDWFREKCNIHIGVICIRFNSPKIKGYQYQLVCDNYTNEKQIGDFKDYYEALNKAIEEALKLI